MLKFNGNLNFNFNLYTIYRKTSPWSYTTEYNWSRFLRAQIQFLNHKPLLYLSRSPFPFVPGNRSYPCRNAEPRRDNSVASFSSCWRQRYRRYRLWCHRGSQVPCCVQCRIQRGTQSCYRPHSLLHLLLLRIIVINFKLIATIKISFSMVGTTT